MLGYERLINFENQFTSSFDIQFGPTTILFLGKMDLLSKFEWKFDNFRTWDNFVEGHMFEA